MSKPRRANCVYFVEMLVGDSWEIRGHHGFTIPMGKCDLRQWRHMCPKNKFRLVKYTASK